MVYVRKMAGRNHLSCCILFVILFTLSACSQTVGRPSALHSPSLAQTSQQKGTQPAPRAGTTQTDIWAGYIARGKRGTYTEASMFFTVPKLRGTRGVADTSASEWVGVGDGLTSPIELVQAGVSSDVDPRGHQTNYAFWEVVGNGLSVSVQPLALTVKPGDRIWVYVGSNANHDGYDGFLVEDLTQGTSQTAYKWDPNAFSDSASAECIVERPSINTGPRPLAQFGTISIRGCDAYTNGQRGMAAIGYFPHDLINMVKDGVTLASPGPLTNGNDFTVTWQNTGS